MSDLRNHQRPPLLRRVAGLQAKTWIFAMLPLIALVTATLFGFRRFLLFFVTLWTMHQAISAGSASWLPTGRNPRMAACQVNSV